MKGILLTSLIIIMCFIYSNNIYTSTEIWRSMKNYTDTGLMVNNEYHFIYDENNYINLDINGDKMKKLYSKQDEIYKNHDKLLNYIFIVNTITTFYESAEEVTKHLANYIESEYGLNADNCILVLILVYKREIYIFSGNNKFSVSDRKTMINNAGEYLKSGQYYEAVKRLIDDFDEYYAKSSLIWLWVVLTVVGLFFVGGFILGLIFCCSSKTNKIFINRDDYNDYRNYGGIDGGLGVGFGGGAGGGGGVVGGSY